MWSERDVIIEDGLKRHDVTRMLSLSPLIAFKMEEGGQKSSWKCTSIYNQQENEQQVSTKMGPPFGIQKRMQACQHFNFQSKKTSDLKNLCGLSY